MTEKSTALLTVEGISKNFSLENDFFSALRKTSGLRKGVQALREVSFSVASGETLGILGESGSGKSTLARVLMGIYPADSGSAYLNGENIFASYQRRSARLKMLKKMQMIFQDPYGSLDPRMTVRQIISEPFRIHGLKIDPAAEDLLARTLSEVGLEKDSLARYPSEFSGGQRQRIGICRAIILNPELIIADEAVSALDVSVQAQILELLCGLRKDRNLSMIFISHDVAVVRQISDRIILLYKGNLVEEMAADCLLRDASHPYTKDLLNSACYLREGKILSDNPVLPSGDKSFNGCCYRPVCSEAHAKCSETPTGKIIHPGHTVYCWKAF